MNLQKVGTNISKVVIFDWGGVVESHEDNLKDTKDAELRLIKRFNDELSDEEILKRWTKITPSFMQIGATNNELEVKDWVDSIQTTMNINVPFEEFRKAYEEEFSKIKYYEDVVKYAHSLKDRCKIGILSNLCALDKVRIDEQYNLSKFDYVYLSFELGMIKPNKEIFEYVLNDLQIEPHNILFIDDNHNNILMAKECGWNTCEAFGYELDKIKDSVDDFLNNNKKA